MAAVAPRADAAAASVGACDLFVLRRVAGNRFVHFGGSGRGAGWAGLIEVTSDDEASLGEALATRSPVRIAHGGKELVFGPYYAQAAAVVAVSNDVVVVFGSDDTAFQGAGDEALRAAATMAADAVESVTPAKQLADELEELEAVRSAMALQGDDVESMMRSLGTIAAEALSCEVAAVYLAAGERLVVVDRGWELRAPGGRVAEALRRALEERHLPYCVQDAGAVPLPAPLGEEEGIRSYYLLELHSLARGALLVAHTDVRPRGFTLLCRRLGLRIADVASAQLSVALTREWCSREAARLHAEFGMLDVA